MTYRRVKPEELPLVQERLNSILSPNMKLTLENCIVIGAFNKGGRLVAFWPAFTAVHCDGLWVDEDTDEPVYLPRLGEEMDKELRQIGIREYFSFPSTDRLEKLATRTGQRRLTLPVYGKELKP